MQSNNNIVTITCKVAFQAEIRRFTLERAEFIVLRDQLLALFPQLEKDTLVVKYTDDEKDQVTISSDEELLVALKLSNNFLRLTLNPSQPEQVESRRGGCPRRGGCGNNATNPAWEAKFNRKFGHCANPQFQQHRIARMTQKREKLAARLAYLEALPPNGNEAVRLRHQEKLRRKLNFLTNCLAKQPLQAPEGGPKVHGFHRWADPEFRQGRIAHMTRQKEKLTQRLATLDSLPPSENDVSRIRHKEKLGMKLKWITERLEHLSNCDGQKFSHPIPQNPEVPHHPAPFRPHFHHSPHAHPHHAHPHHAHPHHAHPHHAHPHHAHPHHAHPHHAHHAHPHFYAHHVHPHPEYPIGGIELDELTQIRSQIAELKLARKKLQESTESESSSSEEESEEVKRAKEEIRERIMELKKLRRNMKQKYSHEQKQHKYGLKHEARAAKKAEYCAAKRLAGLTKQEARIAKFERRARKQECNKGANQSGSEFPNM